jgi:hypothetical protein
MEREDNAGLRLHDMLLSFNGRRIGGMMISELEVELEVCGPLLTLVVSRYKLPVSVEDRIRQAECRYQCEVDRALNDQRRLGWTDLISPSGPGSKITLMGLSSLCAAEECERPGEPMRLGVDMSLQDKYEPKASRTSHLHCVSIPRASVTEASNKDSPQMTVFDSGMRGVLNARGLPLAPKLKLSEDKGLQLHQHMVGNSSVPASQSTASGAKNRDEIMIVDGGRMRSVLNSSGLPLAPKLDLSQDNGPDLHQHMVGNSSVPASQSAAPGTKKGDDIDCTANQFEVGVDDAVQSLVLSQLDNDFENPWMGCACGSVHESDVPVFWIQCDHCESWYNVSPICVGFDEKEAVSLPSWTCWGCPSSDRVTSHRNVGADGTSAVSASGVAALNVA